MKDIAIDVRNVTKRFKMSGGNGATIKRAVIDMLKGGKKKEFTALNDVSFSVARGETLGLIGCNGAGKSTLLSIIAGTMSPTSGSVATTGIVSSLLELGAGFHPDLTGRENVYLYGSIMNIPKATMRKRFDDIVDFSGLGDFIDQPVRFYSSGMYVRLGFAVAVQVNPDILLIDEVLAVGDADFQKRCLAKMDEFRNLGKTLLIISHDMNTIRSVSDRIVFLDHGTVKGIGAPGDLVSKYQTNTLKSREGMAEREWGTGEATITSVKLTDADGSQIQNIKSDGYVHVEIAYNTTKRINTPTFGFSIADADKRTIFGSNTELCGFNIDFIDGSGTLRLTIDASTLHEGSYMLSFSLHSRDHRTNYHRLEQALPIYISKTKEFDGIAALPVAWN